jgi:dynamin 1-like protein
MEEISQVYNRLQTIFNSCNVRLDIDLPQIVVLGSQSSGKSSVLESIVGRDFLPRGVGIVTRRPLVLQLINHGGLEYATFEHKRGKFTDYALVRQEIIDETNQVAEGKSISALPINLKIFSPHVINLSLIDLPGLVSNPLPGQPRDIVTTVRRMILDYISPENTIILAITPANTDIATSEAIQYARQVDPDGERTIGVLTKLDLMDRGTDAVDVLKGEVIPLKLGYVGVVCRSQAEINESLNFESHLENERRFFELHPKYEQFADKLGAPYLAKRLSQMLFEHINRHLPELQSNLDQIHRKKTLELDRLGKSVKEEDKAMKMLEHLMSYSRFLADRLEGRNYDLHGSRMSGAAKIDKIINSDFKNRLLRTLGSLHLSSTSIKKSLENSAGFKGMIFPPIKVLTRTVSEGIVKLLDPSLQCVKEVVKELKEMANPTNLPELEILPKLKTVVMEQFEKILSKLQRNTETLVKNFIRIEAGYINVEHSDFKHDNIVLNKLKLSLAIPKNTTDFEAYKQGVLAELAVSRSRENEEFMGILFANDREDVEDLNVVLLKRLISDYFLLVVKALCDYVPKAIISFIVKKVEETLPTELVNEIYTPENVLELMTEDPQITKKRDECLEALATVEEALDCLLELKEP